jgi:hypothetical protein
MTEQFALSYLIFWKLPWKSLKKEFSKISRNIIFINSVVAVEIGKGIVKFIFACCHSGDW